MDNQLGALRRVIVSLERELSRTTDPVLRVDLEGQIEALEAARETLRTVRRWREASRALMGD